MDQETFNFATEKPEAKKDDTEVRKGPAISLSFNFGNSPSPEDNREIGKKTVPDVGSGEPAIPERSKDAMTGSQFIDQMMEIEKQMKLEGKNYTEIRKRREEEIYNQLRSGNIPDNFRDFKNVQVQMRDENGQEISGTIKVMPDYIAIGNDKDSVRVPMTPATAQLLANEWGCTLPTTKMVDQIYAQARQNGITLNPQPKPPGGQMITTSYFAEHDQSIDSQLSGVAEKNPSIMDGNPLITGDKKDIVLPYHNEGAEHVIIYGWYDPRTGKPIQGYSGGVHEETYADYSHGVRMVAGMMDIRYPDGRTERRSVESVLADPKLSRLISLQQIKNPRNGYPDNAWTRSFDRSSLPVPNSTTTAEPGLVADQSPAGETAPDVPADGSGGNPPGGAVPGTSETGGNVADTAAPPNIPAVATASGSSPESQPPPYQQPQGSGVPSSSPHTTQPYSPASAVADSPTPQEPPSPSPDTSSTPEPQAQVEQREKGPIQGAVLFLGDSISVNMDRQKGITATGEKLAVAGGGQTSKWLLGWIEGRVHTYKHPTNKTVTDLPDPGIIKNFDSVVMLIGTNDIGAAEGRDWTAEAIFGRIEKIWLKLKELNPNIKINAVTIPPFKGYSFSRYGKEFETINKRRKDINQMILKSGIPSAVIDICKTYNPDNPAVSGVTTSDDPDESALDGRAKADKVHPKPGVLAKIYQAALTSGRDDRYPGKSSSSPNPGERSPGFVVEFPSDPSPDTSGQTSSTGTEVAAGAPSDTYIIPADSPVLTDPSQIQRAGSIDPAEGKGRVGDADHPVQGSIPAGYKRVSRVSSKASRYVNNVLKDWRHVPINTTIHFTVDDGREYTARIEWHETPNASSDFIRKPHHGWSVFSRDGQNELNS